MSLHIFSIFVLSCLFVMVYSASPTPTTPPGKECGFWQAMTKGINEGQDLQGDSYTQCVYHPEKCEQLDCSGFINSTMFTAWKFNYCWGMIVNHCDSPISVDVYLQVDSKGVNLSQRIFHNTEVPVPQLSFKRSGTTIGIVLFFELRKNANSTITFKVTAKTSYSVLGAPPYYPSFLQKEIIPETALPVSTCSKVTHTPNITLGKCGAVEGPKTNMSTTPRPAITGMPTEVPPANTGSRTYNKDCAMGDLQNPCHSTEMCQGQDGSKNGRCMCIPGLALCRETGYCSSNSDCTKHITPAPGHVVPIPNKHTGGAPQSTSSGPVNRTALIIGSVCGGVVLLVIIAVVIVFFLKKRGAQYRGRQLLLTEDDTDGII